MSPSWYAINVVTLLVSFDFSVLSLLCFFSCLAQYVPKVTGPGALCMGFSVGWMKDGGASRKVRANHRYSAPDNTTANIPKVYNEWCVRSVLAPKYKNAYYETVGITNYQRMKLHRNISCQDKIWEEFKVTGKH